MEKSRNFQIVYVGRTNLCKHCTTDHAIGIMKLSQRPHSPIAELSLRLVVTTSSAWRVQLLLGSRSSRTQSRCRRHGLSNILKLQATFLYSIYHHRASKTNLFHIQGVDFTILILYVPLSKRTISDGINFTVSCRNNNTAPTERE